MKFKKNIRLKNYDYSANGYYFVTICTDCRKPYFENKNIKDIVVAELARLNELSGVKIDYDIVMSDHIHLIIVLEDTKYSLFEVIRRFKSKTTVFVKKVVAELARQDKLANQGWQLQQRLWQPNYYEHVIRNEKALDKIRRYIANNPNAEKYNWDELEFVANDA